MKRLTPHLRYLRYVLWHKWYVFCAGLAINRLIEDRTARIPIWRLLVHDWSKFLPSEWGPYVANFYVEGGRENAEVQSRFKYAWLYHQRRNKHHWQYWTYRLDERRAEITLIPPARYALEMLADWIGAGQKIITPVEYAALDRETGERIVVGTRRRTLGECAQETVVWYKHNAQHMLLRTPVKQLIEPLLVRAAQEWQ